MTELTKKKKSPVAVGSSKWVLNVVRSAFVGWRKNTECGSEVMTNEEGLLICAASQQADN